MVLNAIFIKYSICSSILCYNSTVALISNTLLKTTIYGLDENINKTKAHKVLKLRTLKAFKEIKNVRIRANARI